MADPWEKDWGVGGGNNANPWDHDWSANVGHNPVSDGSGVSHAGPDAGSVPGQDGLSWGQVGLQALKNTPESALKTGEAMLSPILHPIDTAKAIYHTGIGAAEKLIPGHQEDEKYADAMKQYFVNRYGSVENFKHALATDPVGIATDLSAVATLGGSALARAPGIVGKVGEGVKAVGNVANPMVMAPGITKIASEQLGKVPAIANTAKKVATAIPSAIGSGAAKVIGDVTTGAGSKAIKTAFQSGAKGGEAAQAFLENLRGNAPMEDVVASAKDALSQMRADKSKAYRSGMVDISKDPTVLSFDPVEEAMGKASNVKTFKGKDLSPATKDVRDEIRGIIDDWKGLDPAEYHTPEGFDALKQRIGDVKDNLPYNTPQRLVAEQAYNAVRGAITQQAPAYSKVMKDYQVASDAIEQIQKSLSLGQKASVDTSLRKLQSVMRDNVNTNFGARAKLAENLAEKSPTLLPALAGQALSTTIPRGLAKVSDIGLIGLSGLAHLPSALGMAAISSPRLMGEAAYGLGAAGRYAKAPITAAAPYARATMAATAPYLTEAAPFAYETAAPRQASLADLQGQNYGAPSIANLWASPAYSGSP